ncbi:MAG: 16S rRNA (guanine(966)-N(2))-methyltransferase RsmD [Rudaea sp.]
MKRESSARRGVTGSVRIIGGSLRGSKLAVADLPGLRPTPDRVRETLFNWLAPMISGARCLDLYAGTGALGIEALSRGAAAVEFVERDVALVRTLRDNVERLKVVGATVRHADAARLLEGAAEHPFDIVFIDPPFTDGLWERSAAQLEAGHWLSASALIYVESPATTSIAIPPTWLPHREKHAGVVRYALFSRSAKLASYE